LRNANETVAEETPASRAISRIVIPFSMVRPAATVKTLG
jgi:hypothetical protein